MVLDFVVLDSYFYVANKYEKLSPLLQQVENELGLSELFQQHLVESANCYGNGLYNAPLKELACASHDLCIKKADFQCSRCKLVKYCSKECQVKHWPKHKHDCQGELPPFTPTAPSRHPNRGTSLWGNIPAFDVVNWSDNEGKEKQVKYIST